MVAKKAKAALSVAIPQNDEEANALVATYGETFNAIARGAVDLTEAVAKVKAESEQAALPLQLKLIDIQSALETYGAANRKRLTANGETKTVKLAAGEIGWRNNPPKVKIKRGLKVEDLIASIRELGLRKFLRASVDVNKRAMLDDPDNAKKIPGVTIVSNVEEFYVAPFGAELAEPSS